MDKATMAPASARKAAAITSAAHVHARSAAETTGEPVAATAPSASATAVSAAGGCFSYRKCDERCDRRERHK